MLHMHGEVSLAQRACDMTTLLTHLCFACCENVAQTCTCTHFLVGVVVLNEREMSITVALCCHKALQLS